VNRTPKVSAIIANWNGAHHLRICLPSLLTQSYQPLEVIVADNGSSDNSAEVTREFRSTWLPLGKNIGLAPALNRGAAIATGEMLLFVNNDMRFDRGFVGALVRALQSDNSVFATDGTQFNWDGGRREHLAARLTKHKTVSQGFVELVPGLYFYPQEERRETPVFMASAACMLARKAFFDELQGFDARLPLGYEDVEICWRAWVNKWKVVYVPDAVCWHRVGSSTRSLQGERLGFQGVLTGRLLFASKLLPFGYAVRTWVVSTAAIFKDLRSPGRWPFAKDRIRILAKIAVWLPELFRERKTLFSNARTSPDQHLAVMLQLTNERHVSH
jgi:GT2 family glycosyltransferase